MQVSIHAAQAGCDCGAPNTMLIGGRFNSRSPSGLRPYMRQQELIDKQFQFTQPKRAATGKCFGCMRMRCVSIHAAQAGCDGLGLVYTRYNEVSIHAAQAGCDKYAIYHQVVLLVSIHAAQAGCDCDFSTVADVSGKFQFTQPKRAATEIEKDKAKTLNVSIHAAQAGCDLLSPPNPQSRPCFNSRSPSGLRLHSRENEQTRRGFNSRSPSGLRHNSILLW